MTISLFFVVLALVLLLLAGVNLNPHPRVHLGWLAMFCWLLSTVLKQMFQSRYFPPSYFAEHFFDGGGGNIGSVLDIQVSYVRILIGDNSRLAPVYSDAQIRSAIRLDKTRPALPLKLKLAGVAAATRYPSDVSGGPFTGPF